MSLIQGPALLIRLAIATFLCTQVLSSANRAWSAAQEAKVVANKAVIYADKEMTSPIGFLPRGKKVMVGEVKRNKGKVLPIAIGKRIAYIKVTDIQTAAQSLAGLEEEKAQDKISRKVTETVYKQWLEFRYMSFISTLSNEDEIVEKSQYPINLSGAGLKGHLWSNSRRSTRISLEHIVGTADKESINLYNVDIEASFTLLMVGKGRFNFYAGGSLIPHAQYEVKSLFRKNGYGFGVQAGAELVVPVAERYHLHFDGGYRYKRIMGIALPEPLDELTFSPTLSGVQLSAGFSYAF